MVANLKVLEVGAAGQITPYANPGTLLSDVQLLIANATPRYDSVAQRHVLDFTEHLTRTDSAEVRKAATAMDPTALLRLQGQFRADSGFGAGMGGAEPRDLVFKRELQEEALPKLNALEHFSLDRDVPAGAIEYEMYREYAAGEAVIYMGGGNVPTVQLGRAAIQRPTRFLVTAYDETFIDRLRSAFLGRDTTATKRRKANRILWEKANALWWQGNEDAGLWGVLNHPYMDKSVSPINARTGAVADVIDAVTTAAFYAHVTSKQTFGADACIMSPKLHQYLSTRRIGDRMDTVLEFVQKACSHIKSWKVAWELQGAGPGSEDGMLFYASNSDQGLAPILTMPPTPLPVQSAGIHDRVFVVMGIGDVCQKQVGNNCLVWFPVS